MNAAKKLMLYTFLCLVLLNAQATDQPSDQVTDQAIEKITIKLDFIPDIEAGKTTFSVCARSLVASGGRGAESAGGDDAARNPANIGRTVAV